MRLLITGGRNYDDRDFLCKTISDRVNEEGGIAEILCGDAKGADMLARHWAEENNVKCRVFKAEWDLYGNEAGMRRNAQMLIEGNPTAVIAFPGGPGTRNMVRQARKADIAVLQVDMTLEWRHVRCTYQYDGDYFGGKLDLGPNLGSWFEKGTLDSFRKEFARRIDYHAKEGDLEDLKLPTPRNVAEIDVYTDVTWLRMAARGTQKKVTPWLIDSMFQWLPTVPQKHFQFDTFFYYNFSTLQWTLTNLRRPQPTDPRIEVYNLGAQLDA